MKKVAYRLFLLALACVHLAFLGRSQYLQNAMNRNSVQVSADKTEVYPGEQVTITYHLLTRMNPDYLGPYQFGDFGNAWIGRLGPPPQKSELELTFLEGNQFLEFEKDRFAVIPVKPGRLEVKPPSVLLQFNQKESPRNYRLAYDFPAIEVTVKDFPTDEQPESFNGWSGVFSIGAKVDTTELTTKGIIHYLIHVNGKGNLQELMLPAPNMGLDFTLDAIKSEVVWKWQGSVLTGRKTFNLAMIPRRVGELVMPALEIDYFHIGEEIYKVLKLEKKKIKVDRLALLPMHDSETNLPSDPRLLILLDITKSMLTKDIENKSRLSISKSSLTQWLRNQNLGLVALQTFTTETKTILRFSNEHDATLISESVAAIESEIENESTIADMLLEVSNILDHISASGESKTIVLVTDSQDDWSYIGATHVAEKARELDVRVHVIAVAKRMGDLFPTFNAATGKKIEAHSIAVDSAHLEAIARITNGTFHHVTKSSDFKKALAEIQTLL